MHDYSVEALAGAGSNVNGSLGGPYKATDVSHDLPNSGSDQRGQNVVM